MSLTSAQILFILDLISEKHGKGYSDDPEIGKLQARLSIMLEIARKRERSTGT